MDGWQAVGNSFPKKLQLCYPNLLNISKNLKEHKIISVQSTDCTSFEVMAIIQMLSLPMRTLKVLFIDMAKQILQ